MYSKGTGVPQDDAKAAEWNRRAAELGDAVGQFNVGILYANGKGVERDEIRACAWLNLAAANQITKAVAIREKIEAGLTPEQRAAAARLAEELAEKIGPPRR